MTKLCTLAVAPAVIGRARVAVLPGWVVPLPMLVLAAEITACAAFLVWPGRRAHRPAPAPAGGLS